MKQKLRLNNCGFTLVEVLVAVVILSIGLLAVAGMQTTSLRGGGNALYRSQAVLACEDILDRMRANRANALNGEYDIALAVATENQAGMTLTDLSEWKNSLALNLPGGDGSVAINGRVVLVIVRWTDSYGQDEVEMVTHL